MLRVVFDKNVPYPLRWRLTGCQAQTAEDEGWDKFRTGNWSAASRNMARWNIAMVVVGSNVWPSVRKKTGEIAAALKRASRGSFEFIEIDPPPSGVGFEMRPRSVSESTYSVKATISSTRTYQSSKFGMGDLFRQ